MSLGFKEGGRLRALFSLDIVCARIGAEKSAPVDCRGLSVFDGESARCCG